MSNAKHFFATCAFGWQVAATRDEAVEKIIKRFKTSIINCTKNSLKEGGTGFYIWTCQVDADIDADYAIEFYRPKGVPISEGVEHYVVYCTTKQATCLSPYTDHGKQARITSTKYEL